ncbi:MAG TPA: YdeI/OmpD-associated family protein [Candidatus Saccharimonadales bacterium]
MKELPIIPFTSPVAMEQWLEEHHATKDGIWLKMAKKHSGIPSITYDEALDIALCFGWIDGQRKSYDSNFFIQKFTPRRPRSLWSSRNVKKVAALTAAGRMRPAGLAQVTAAKQDGRWERAYGNHEEMPIPADFLAALEANPTARTTFDSLKKVDRYQIAFRLTTAIKPETRQRRFAKILDMLEKGSFR